MKEDNKKISKHMEIKQKMNEKKSTNERGRCKRKILTTQN
jgi:hypothetical protein